MFSPQFSISSYFTVILVLFFGLIACTTQESRLAPQYNEADLPAIDSTIFRYGVVMSTLQGDKLTEVSGIAPTIRDPGSWWMINDSGNGARLYRVDTTGTSTAAFILEGISNRDWEDMAVRRNPQLGQSEILIADIGDNRAIHDYYYVYRLAEPIVTNSMTPVDIPRTEVTRYTFQYPDGARDAEAFMIDPVDQQWYIISKREDRVRVYRYACLIDIEPCQDRIVPLEQVSILPIKEVTASDISSDGMEILIRTYVQVYYWKRRSRNESLEEVFKRAPVRIPRQREAQGESIAFYWDASIGFITTSELADAQNQPVHKYQRW